MTLADLVLSAQSHGDADAVSPARRVAPGRSPCGCRVAVVAVPQPWPEMHTRRVYKLQEFVAHGSRVNCVHISRNTGSLVATGGDDTRVNLWALGKPHALVVRTPPSAAASGGAMPFPRVCHGAHIHLCVFVSLASRLASGARTRNATEPGGAHVGGDLRRSGRRRGRPRRRLCGRHPEAVGRHSQQRCVTQTCLRWSAGRHLLSCISVA